VNSLSITDLRSEIWSALAEELANVGFLGKPSNCKFVRRSGHLMQEFRVQAFRHGAGHFVKPLVQVSWTPICRIYNEIAQPKVPLRYSLLGFGIANEYSGRGEYYIPTRESIAHSCSRVKRDFAEIAFPFFESHKDLEAIEKGLNRQMPDGSYAMPISVTAACTGLIAASLCGRADLDQMAESYYAALFSERHPGLTDVILRVRDGLRGKGAGA
jgi:hypothetical protein